MSLHERNFKSRRVTGGGSITIRTVRFYRVSSFLTYTVSRISLAGMDVVFVSGGMMLEGVQAFPDTPESPVTMAGVTRPRTELL